MKPDESVFRLLPEQASTLAGEVDFLYLFTMGMSIVTSLLVALLIVVFCVRYRRGGKHDQLQRPQTSLRIELLFLSLLCVLFLGMFSWAARVYARLLVPQEPVERVFVVGKQWMWKLQYSSGRRTINQLTVPLGRAMELVMSSQDVIHSFFVPAFRVKQDVLPFRYTRIWFKASKLGSYHLFCTEYCGADHSRMIGQVRVIRPAEFARWLNEGGTPSGSTRDEGRAVFERYACNSCHDPERRIGPTLDRAFGRPITFNDGSTAVADEDYLRRSILDPQAQIVAGYGAVMPSYAGRIDEEQLRALIEYIKTLQQGARDVSP